MKDAYVIDVIILLIFFAFFAFLWIRSNSRNKKNILLSVNYLSGMAIRHGDFSGLEDADIELLRQYKKPLICELSFLLTDNPEKLINFINLELKKEKKLFITQIIADRLNFSIDLTIDIAFKIWQREKGVENCVSVISFIACSLSLENQLVFKEEIERNIREAGGCLRVPLKQTPVNAQK